MNPPTLLVGLGGTGSKIVAKVSEMITDEQRRNISCVIFDTDANDIPQIQAGNPEIKVVQTSARMTVGEYLEEDHYAKDNWFPVNPPLDRKVLSEGAGQVRSISRLGFESALRTGRMKPLEQAIADLYKVDERSADQALRVTIVSSLAGGTGSGLIVPVAMYIRRYLEDHFHNNANLSRGFFILPEVFYDAIPADQRSNLQSNAYASLRELDAFLMKGNKTLPPEYEDSVRLIMPRVGSVDQREDYNVSPYDFCFLFDAQNASGEKLNSLEQYMDHAANIIYSMSIGPMNKRSNSSEDNVIRKLAKERGRNRYAGAGASRLIYPYADITRLIGLNWAKTVISDQWLEYDRQIRRQKENALRRREAGYLSKDIDEDDQYISLIQADADARKPFASFIRSQVERDEQKDTESLYITYLEALQNYIISSSAKALGAMIQGVTDCNELAKTTADIDEKKQALADSADMAAQYKKQADHFIESDARNIAYSVFEGAANEGAGQGAYFLETIIRAEGEYLHPNALRYFLIRTRQQMQILKQTAGINYQNALDAYANIPDEGFVALDGAAPLNYEIKGFGKKKKMLAALNEAADEAAGRKTTIDQILTNGTLKEVYEHGIQYLDTLIESMNGFFGAFEEQLAQINGSMQEIANRYTQAPGMTVRYVAASRPCLQKLVERYPYTGSLIAIDSKLSEQIAAKAFNYARMQKKPNLSRYYTNLFQDDIIGYYQEAANQRVAASLDQGILRAIELEADLVLDEEQKASALAVDHYVRNVISATRSLATPFIEKPNELAATAIDACAFHTSLVPQRGDESYEAKLISEELIAHGGIGDDDIDRNTILFYQSYYGLRANSLSKFAPPKVSETLVRSGGEYFSAYTELVRGIHPNSRKSQEITPHIDKSWHLAAKMPDLDEGNQVIEEYAINAAFFWAVALCLIDLHQESSGKNLFSLKAVRLGLEDGTLVSKNGEESSKIYEVLEGLAMQTPYVDAIRAYAKKRMRDESSFSRGLKNEEIYKAICSLNVPVESGYRALSNTGLTNLLSRVTIFELPLVIKTSMPLGSDSDRKMIELFEVILRETQSYLSGFCSPEEIPGVIRTYMEGQLAAFEAAQKADGEDGKENALRKEICESASLCADLLDTAANNLESHNLYDLSGKIRDYADALKRTEALND